MTDKETVISLSVCSIRIIHRLIVLSVGKSAKPSMTEPPTPNRVKVFGTDLRLKDSGPRAFLPSTSLTF
jgi:hypothetical protein